MSYFLLSVREFTSIVHSPRSHLYSFALRQIVKGDNVFEAYNCLFSTEAEA